jgi:hypothetical protein
VHYNVQAEESSPDNEVHFHMHDRVIDVPVVREAESTEESTDGGGEFNTPTSASLSDDDFSDILAENGFNPEVSEAYDELMNAIDEAEADSLEEGTQEETPELAVEVTTTGRNLIEDTPRESEVTQATMLEEYVADNSRRRRPSRNSNTEEPAREEIPLNSPTLLIDSTTSRFSGAEWYNEIQKQRIIIAGIGGIGSNLIYQLARMSPAAIYMYDDDMVETVNMAGQLYSIDDVGKAKVDAMEDMIRKYTSMQNIFAIKERFTSLTEAGDIMICGFDNMAARKTFFYSWQTHVASLPEEDRGKCLFLDGRLSMNELQVLCIKGDDVYNMDRYEQEFLFSDAEAEETVCSMKQTTYLASMIGSVMVNLFTNFVADLLDPIIPYDLPFFTEYDAQNMIFKTEN